MDIGFVMGFKRLILKTVMKINRAQQKKGTSIYKSRHSVKLLGKLINFLSHTPKDVQVRMLTINSIYGMKLTPAKKGSHEVVQIDVRQTDFLKY
jgi:hypothetical protein